MQKRRQAGISNRETTPRHTKEVMFSRERETSFSHIAAESAVSSPHHAAAGTGQGWTRDEFSQNLRPAA